MLIKLTSEQKQYNRQANEKFFELKTLSANPQRRSCNRTPWQLHEVKTLQSIHVQ